MKTFSIRNGPSKYELSIAFFDVIGGHRRPVTFEFMADGFKQADIVIDKIAWEDGSGQNWIFEGYVIKSTSKDSDFVNSRQINGYFNTNRRTGWLRPGKATW